MYDHYHRQSEPTTHCYSRSSIGLMLLMILGKSWADPDVVDDTREVFCRTNQDLSTFGLFPLHQDT
jgi:hypothetical protein